MEDEKRDRSNIRQSVVDLRPELHPVNWFESFKLLKADLAMHAVRIVYARKKNMSICQICYYTMVEIDYPFGAQERLLICAAAERRLQWEAERGQVKFPRTESIKRSSIIEPLREKSVLAHLKD